MSRDESPFYSNLSELIQLCEAQMRAEGWLKPGFNEADFVHLPSYATCQRIDELIAGAYRIRSQQDSVPQFDKRGSWDTATLDNLKLYQDEALVWDLLPETAVRLSHQEKILSTIGYIGVMPLLDEKTDMKLPPYTGPFLVGSLRAIFSFTPSARAETRQATNPFAFLSLRDASFPSLYLPQEYPQPTSN